ncbi:hypothetical protein BDW74DRAFT_148739 [Aspergillus multicolor]|uniref:MAPEG family protein n=1 Tax=Aspergillus multicolor TaxID=41759 RepID=UPI003CCD914D
MSLSTSPILSLSLLRPIIVLNAWTFTMELWMYITRIPVFSTMSPPPSNTMTKSDLDKLTPASVRWKADNYNHLHEQPTQFYAIVLALAFARYVRGDEESKLGVDVALAWMYVGLRVLHSFVHVTRNWIMLRFGVFVISSGVLVVLAGRAAAVIF